MDIDDIIKNLAPFAFVIVWVISAVFNRGQSAVASKTSSPIFTPPRRSELSPSKDLDSATEAAEQQRPSKVDWDDLVFEPQVRTPKPAPPTQNQVLAVLKADLQAKAKARAEAKAKAQYEAESKSRFVESAESKARQVFPDFAQSQSTVPPPQANLAHLVPEHFAEVHLDHALNTPKFGSPLQPVTKSSPMNDLVTRLRQPQAARDAMIFSIIMGEPRSKTPRPLG
jgi:hypothetical protein